MPARRWNFPSQWSRWLQGGIAALIICFFCFFLLFFGWTSRVEQGFFYALSWSGTSIHALYERIFSTRAKLEQERNHYRDLAGSLALQAADAATLREQIKNLEDAMHYTANGSRTPVLAHILSRTDQLERTILVNQGTEEGIQTGDAAFIHEGHLIGVVNVVWNHTARIRLIGDQNSHVPASILGQNGQTIGIVDGQGGYLLNMRFIPRDQPIAVGQLVITSGLDGHLPEGLVLGTVSQVIQEDRALFQEAFIEPLFPLDQETEVILLPSF